MIIQVCVGSSCHIKGSPEIVELFQKAVAEYNLDDDINRIYFFNPFSVTVLNDVIDNIKKSLEKKPREILLFFYYPSKEYLSFLTKTMHLENVENIDCRHLFNNDDLKEFIGIYKI